MARANVKINYLLNLSYQIFALLAPLITAPYVSRVLGADGVGAYSYSESITSYFVLFAVLGSASYGQREVSYLQDDHAKRTTLFWNVACFRIITTAIVLPAYVVFSSFQENPALFLALSFNILSVAFDFTWLFQGMEDFRTVVLRNFLVRLASIAFIFIFIRERSDLILYAIVITGTPLIGSILIIPYLKRYVGRPSLRLLQPFSNIKTVLSLFLPAIAVSIYTVLDKTMIGVLTAEASQNGYYEQALKISRMALTIVTSLGAVMVPRIGHLFAIGDYEQLSSYMYKSYRFVWALGIPLCLGLIATAPNFVPWFFGEEFLGAIPVLQVLAMLVIAIGMSSITGVQYLIPIGRQNTLTATLLIGAVCNFLLNFAMIPSFGAFGAAVASVVTEVLVSAIQLFVVRKQLSPLVVVKSSGKYAVAGSVMFAVLCLLDVHLDASIASTLCQIGIGIITYALMLLLLRDKLLYEFGAVIKKTLFKLKK